MVNTLTRRRLQSQVPPHPYALPGTCAFVHQQPRREGEVPASDTRHSLRATVLRVHLTIRPLARRSQYKLHSNQHQTFGQSDQETLAFSKGSDDPSNTQAHDNNKEKIQNTTKPVMPQTIHSRLSLKETLQYLSMYLSYRQTKVRGAAKPHKDTNDKTKRPTTFVRRTGYSLMWPPCEKAGLEPMFSPPHRQPIP